MMSRERERQRQMTMRRDAKRRMTLSRPVLRELISKRLTRWDNLQAPALLEFQALPVNTFAPGWPRNCFYIHICKYRCMMQNIHTTYICIYKDTYIIIYPCSQHQATYPKELGSTSLAEITLNFKDLAVRPCGEDLVAQTAHEFARDQQRLFFGPQMYSTAQICSDIMFESTIHRASPSYVSTWERTCLVCFVLRDSFALFASQPCSEPSLNDRDILIFLSHLNMDIREHP